MNGSKHVYEYGVRTERFRFHGLNIGNGIVGREALIQNEVRRNDARASADASMAVHQDAFICCCQDEMHLTGHLTYML